MTTLGLDASSKVTGWCFADNGVPTRWGLCESKGSTPFKRCISTRDFVLSLLNGEQIDIAYLEDIQMQNRNVLGYKTLAWNQALVMSELHSYDVKFEVVSPSTWRSAFGFTLGKKKKRDELKQCAVDYVRDRFGIDEGDDVAEAVCLAIHKGVIDETGAKRV